MALGRGLGALISSSGTGKKIETDQSTQDRVWHIPVSSICANSQQPRKHFDAQELDELAASIKEHGVLQPILVTEKTDGGYELISGERRWRGTQIAGLATVPSIIKKLADQQKLEVALIENIQREDLNPIEEAFAYKRLMDEFDLTQQDVADKVGKSRPAIANAVRLLDLPEQVKNALMEGKINTGQARALLTLESAPKQLEMLASMLGQKITVRELERKVVEQIGAVRVRRDPNLLYLEDQLRAALGTKVSISQKGQKGNISIEYYSKEELGKLVKRIIGN